MPSGAEQLGRLQENQRVREPEPLRDTRSGAKIFGVVVVTVAALIIVFLWRPWTIPHGATTNATTAPIARPTPAASTMPVPANMQHYEP